MLADLKLAAACQTAADLCVEVSAFAVVCRWSSTSDGLATAWWRSVGPTQAWEEWTLREWTRWPSWVGGEERQILRFSAGCGPFGAVRDHPSAARLRWWAVVEAMAPSGWIRLRAARYGRFWQNNGRKLASRGGRIPSGRGWWPLVIAAVDVAPPSIGTKRYTTASSSTSSARSPTRSCGTGSGAERRHGCSPLSCRAAAPRLAYEASVAEHHRQFTRRELARCRLTREGGGP
jgi:hypothetical protein